MSKLIKVHPASWTIRNAKPKTGKKVSNSLQLPMPAGEPDMVVPTVAIKSLMRIYSADGQILPTKANQLYQTLRWFDGQKTKLTDIRGVNNDSALALKEWQQALEKAMDDFVLGTEEVQAKTEVKEPKAPEPQTDRLAFAEFRLEIAKEAMKALIGRYDDDMVDKAKVAGKAFEYADEMIKAFEATL